jgi:DNA polymerase-3 subunit beta
MASSDYQSSFTVSPFDLGRMFGKTAFAMSTEETKYYLNGVYIHPSDEGLTTVATDAHKLAKVVIDLHVMFPSVIVPRKTVSEVRKSLSDDPIDVSVSDTKIRFKSGNTVIVSKVIDGTFPEYTRVIPKDNPSKFTVNAQDMREASDRVAMVAEDKTRAVALSIGDGVVALESKGSTSEAQDEVDAEIEGAKTRIGFNSRYLADTLAQCDTGKVTIWYSGETSPCLIRPDDDAGFLAVLMPMRC